MKNKSMIIGIVVILLIAAGVTIPKFIGGRNESVSEQITITHVSGDTLVNTNPKRVVVFDYGILDSLDALEIEGIVGVVQDGLPGYLSKYAGEEYSAIGTLKEPDMEKIFELTPDLIIITGRQADYYEELNKIAPTINLAMDTSDYLGSFKSNMNTLAQIFGKEKEVTTKVEEIENRVYQMIPANMELFFDNRVYGNPKGGVSLSNGLVAFEVVLITHDFIGDFSAENNVVISQGSTSFSVETITNDYQEEVELQSTAYQSGGNVVIETVEIKMRGDFNGT